MRSSISSGVARLAAALAACAPLAVAPGAWAQTVPVQREQRAYDLALAEYRAGNAAAALGRVERALKSEPRELQLRFLRGVLLSELGRRDEAAAAFLELTQQYPELPEPHNNLAVIYAGRGEIDRAREALENAIRAVPDYALAHENLGDIYLQIAARSYQQAVGLDPANRSAASKLALARDLVERIRSTTRAAPPPAPR